MENGQDHTIIYTQKLKLFQTRLQIHRVLEELVELEVITTDEQNRVLDHQYQLGPQAAAEFFIMEVMVRKHAPTDFHKFVEALRRSEQNSMARQMIEAFEQKFGVFVEVQLPPHQRRHLHERRHPFHTRTNQIPAGIRNQETPQVGQASRFAAPDVAVAAASKSEKQEDPTNQHVQQPPVDIPVKLPPLDVKALEINRNNRIGQGNFGCVYKCDYAGTCVAVKEMGIPKKKKYEIDKLVVNEIEVSAAVRHESIVQFMGYCVQSIKGFCYLLLVYEFIDGTDLSDILIDDETKEEYSFHQNTKKYDVLLQISQALAYLHTHTPQIIHGDIKPANVMVDKRGRVKLCDLGLSKMKLNTGMTMASTAATRGTPFYMAPEQLIHKRTSSAKTDVYSFGALMYETLFEDFMWDIDEVNDTPDQLKEIMKAEKMPRRLNDNVDDPAYGIIVKCVQFEHDRRAEALSLVKELKELYENSYNKENGVETEDLEEHTDHSAQGVHGQSHLPERTDTLVQEDLKEDNSDVMQRDLEQEQIESQENLAALNIGLFGDLEREEIENQVHQAEVDVGLFEGLETEDIDYQDNRAVDVGLFEGIGSEEIEYQDDRAVDFGLFEGLESEEIGYQDEGADDFGPFD